MTLVLVTGGTGHLGQDLVNRLVRQGHQVRIFARTPRDRGDVEWAIGDLATGAGLPDALRGVHTVINAATHSPIARRGGIRPVDFFKSPQDVDADGTKRLLDLCSQASVQHFLHVSIVGLEDASLPYARIKLAGERMRPRVDAVVVGRSCHAVLLSAREHARGPRLASGMAGAENRPQSGRYVGCRRLSGEVRVRRHSR